MSNCPNVISVFVILGVGKENYLMTYSFIEVTHYSCTGRHKSTRPTMPAARGEESERMICTCI